MDIGAFLASSAAILLVSIALSVGGALLGIWLAYTVIWRAVRRGMREHHHDTLMAASRENVPSYPPPTWR